jgi:hypothetical protein
VYLLEFNPLVLTTKFSDWVDPNLLRLGPNEEQPTEITIDNFRISPETLATEPKRENFYRAQFVVVDGRLGVRSLEVEQANEWKKITPQPEQLRQIESGLGGIAALRFVKIRPKDKALANALLNPSEPATAEVLNANVDYGFRSGTNDLLPANMISTGGRIDVKTRNNVILRILFGNIETSVDTESKLCRLTAIIAVADLDSLPKPAPPTPADGEKLSEEEERQFARTLEEWNSQVTKAQNIANGYNQLHRQWFYAVDEGIVSALRPDLPDLNSNPEIDPAVAEPPKATEQQSTEQQSNEQQATENQATEKKTSEGDDGQEQDK